MHQESKVPRATAILSATALVLFIGSQNDTFWHTPLRSTFAPTVSCTLRSYVPSAWESQWLESVDATYSQDSICPRMQQSSDLSKQWLDGVLSCQRDVGACGDDLSTQVFSKFVKVCTPEKNLRASGRAASPVVVEEYIEPLVGHMRHPHGLAACTPQDSPVVDVQDRSYLMMLGASTQAARARHPGRAILVDAGTNAFHSSVGYLLSAYSALGIHFDAIYAWEASPVDASKYWASVPDDVKPRLHFYNAPVTPEVDSSMNPVKWIKNMHRPGDFIVFKLDIDNDAIESALIQQVLDMEGAGEVVAEMYFEKHYAAKDMAPYFGRPETEYPAAVRLMQALRKKGVRVHYWP